MRLELGLSRSIRLALGIAALGGAPSYPLQSFAEEQSATFEVYGFAMADYVQDFRRVNPAWDDTLRPSKIPTANGTYGTDGQAIISPRQSRFGVKATLPVGPDVVDTKFEFDFFGVGVDEGQTTIRLRHAYGEWKEFLGGQTHSLFMDVDIFPNVIDYWGPAGMVFLRNPQLRWTPVKGKLSASLAIEKPSNDIDPGQLRTVATDLGVSITNDEKLPDLTGQVRYTQDWGHVQLAGVLRRVGFETVGNPGNSPFGFKVGWGGNLTSVIKVLPTDKLLLGLVYGHGIASYMNDGGTDLAPDGAPGALDAGAVPLTGVSLYLDHSWNDRMTTSLGYSRTQVQNLGFQSDNAFHLGEYASVNFLVTPAKNVMMGVELLWGRRVDKNTNQGNDLRSQISFKYSFSSKDVPTRL